MVKNEILGSTNSASIIIDDMISKANAQGAKNFDMLFSVKHGLDCKRTQTSAV